MKRIPLGETYFFNVSRADELVDGEYFPSTVDLYALRYSWLVNGAVPTYEGTNVEIIAHSPALKFNKIGVYDITLEARLPDPQTPRVAVFTERVLCFAESPRIATLELPVIRVGIQCSIPILLEPGTGSGPFKWQLLNAPEGLWITDTGIISGAPVIPGNYRITVVVQDAQLNTDRRSYHLKVDEGPISIAITGRLPDAYVGALYTAQIAVYTYTGHPPISWSISGLDPFLALFQTGERTAEIRGIPRSEFSNNIRISVVDSIGESATVYTTLTARDLRASIKPVTGEYSECKQSTPYSYQFELAYDDVVHPITWSIADAPVGLQLNSATGLLTGTPPISGSNYPRVSVTDGVGRTTSYDPGLLLVHGVPPVIAQNSLPPARIGVAYSAILSTTFGYGSPPVAWDSEGMPDGLLLIERSYDEESTMWVQNYAHINGTPTKAGVFPVRIKLKDRANFEVEKTLILEVLP